LPVHRIRTVFLSAMQASYDLKKAEQNKKVMQRARGSFL